MKKGQSYFFSPYYSFYNLKKQLLTNKMFARIFFKSNVTKPCNPVYILKYLIPNRSVKTYYDYELFNLFYMEKIEM
jgi:hypothetical protein